MESVTAEQDMIWDDEDVVKRGGKKGDEQVEVEVEDVVGDS